MIKPFAATVLLSLLPALPAVRGDEVRIEVGNAPVMAPGVRLSDLSHVYIGVELLPVDQPTRTLFKMKDAGMLVIGIAPGSPCDGMIGQGDILLSAGDFPISVKGNLRAFLWNKQAGDVVVFTILRGGKEKKVNIRLADKQTALASAPAGEDRGAVVPEEMMRRLVERTRQAAGENRDFFANASRDVAVIGSGNGVHISSTRLIKKPEGTVVIFRNDGVTSVIVTDKDGNTVVSGKLDDALRGKVPAWARSASEELATEAPAPDAKPASDAKPGA